MPDTIEVKIEKIAAGGAGLARHGGQSVFVDGAIPGETVSCRATENHHSWIRAELLEIIEASPDRVLPLCGLYCVCGGCNMQHLSYTAQIAAKTGILKESFMRIGNCRVPEPQVFPAETTAPAAWEYRNRMQFHVLRQPNTLLGLKIRKNAGIIPISDCPIADPGIREMVQGKTQMAIPPERDRFTVFARNGLFLQEGGKARGKTRLLNQELTLDAGVFFQSNGAKLEKLIADLQGIAGGACQKDAPIADLYCGVGTFAAFLGHLFPHIDLVEENKTALALARENLKSHESAAFYAQRSENWAKSSLKPQHYGFIVADPPRQGFDPALASLLAKNGPPLLAYVSCDPATLARDSKILMEGGYELADLHWYDFYPQTAHIESLAFFAR